ncbi:hypothetical protein [Candidatus Igneacidithiobacillus taiwanensis]|uniref:hypothetical protein n=1 Tax=Candidatus Igneacidithiobacillus taiwanensis TaxID=1945924 RepID=UPI0028A2D29E|nr:hypothetical protein [Candidatus Igneacidithiobacillus taiwanensis]MCE5360580.1 hypothetical protein [Acidithiobacillus sp.]
MDYQVFDQQYNQIAQATQNNIQGLQQVAQKLQTAVPDSVVARELILDLRNMAMNLQSQQQNINFLLQQMGQRIQQLEMQMQQAAGQPGMNPAMAQRPWNAPAQGMGSGFMGNVMTGLGLGAGFAVADNIVDDIFNMF